MARIGGHFDTPAPTPWAQSTLTSRLLAAANGSSSPDDVPVVCLTECPVRPRKVQSADELLAQHALLRAAPVVLAVHGTPYECVPAGFWTQVRLLRR